MIRRGLRINDDSDTEVKQERITLDANRKRDKFQQDMDSFLFGGPVRKRQVKKQQIQKKTQISITSKQSTSTIIKKTQLQIKKDSQPIIVKTQQIAKQSFKQKTFQKLNSPNLQETQIKQTNSSIVEANSSNKNSRVSKLTASNVVPHKVQNIKHSFLGEKQKSLPYIDVQGSKPNYIRKLRHVAQNYGFQEENKNKNTFIDVVRPAQCLKNYINKKNVLNFRDKQFTSNRISLGPQLFNNQVTWKKCEDFLNHSTLGKYIDPNDIKKGTFSSIKFLSILSVLAQNQQNIKRLIQEQIYNPNGLYYARLYINSVWRYIALDTYIPFNGNNNCASICYNDSESDLWVSLVQKAYAKCFNGYDVFLRPQPRQYYLRDLTGAPTSNYKFDNSQTLDIIKKSIDAKKIVAVVLKNNAQELGLNSNCSLTVMNTNKKNGLTLRYSWPLIHQKSGVSISKQGILDLSEIQIQKYVSYATVAHLNCSYFTTTIQTRHQKEFFVSYKIIINDTTHGYFTLSQFDQRLFPKQGYQYQPSRLFLQRKTENRFQYVTGGFCHGSRNLDVQVELTPGQYNLFAFIDWKQQVYDFNVTFYGSKKIQFSKIQSMKNYNLISLGLQNYNIQNGKRSALGHVHQYISYHQQTNQILLSITNTSAKPYTYTQDLMKINFQTLHLMNLINNQTQCLQNMTKQELIKTEDGRYNWVVNKYLHGLLVHRRTTMQKTTKNGDLDEIMAGQMVE